MCILNKDSTVMTFVDKLTASMLILNQAYSVGVSSKQIISGNNVRTELRRHADRFNVDTGQNVS